MGRTLFIVMAMMGLFSALASRPGSGGRSPSFDRNATEFGGAGEAADKSDAEPLDGNAVALDRSADGHFYADVEINGASVKMLVDTGASGVALSREAARSAGIATSIGMNDVVGQGAGGAVHGEQVRLDRVRLGSASAEDVYAVVLDGGEMSLLGQDFLERFDSVEIKDDRMILR